MIYIKYLSILLYILVLILCYDIRKMVFYNHTDQGNAKATSLMACNFNRQQVILHKQIGIYVTRHHKKYNSSRSR